MKPNIYEALGPNMRALAADANRRSFAVWEEQTIDSEAFGTDRSQTVSDVSGQHKQLLTVRRRRAERKTHTERRWRRNVSPLALWIIFFLTIARAAASAARL